MRTLLLAVRRLACVRQSPIHDHGGCWSVSAAARFAGDANTDVCIKPFRGGCQDQPRASLVDAEGAAALALIVGACEPQLIGPLCRQLWETADSQQDLIR